MPLSLNMNTLLPQVRLTVGAPFLNFASMASRMRHCPQHQHLIENALSCPNAQQYNTGSVCKLTVYLCVSTLQHAPILNTKAWHLQGLPTGAAARPPPALARSGNKWVQLQRQTESVSRSRNVTWFLSTSWWLRQVLQMRNVQH